MDKEYLGIVSHYESCLQRHGDTHLGVDWPRQKDAEISYGVMLDVILRADRDASVQLLDFGCGASHLYEYILTHRMDRISYSGLDLSKKFIELSKSKFPAVNYYCVDLLNEGAIIPNFNYIVMNGVFTEKCGLSFDEMFSYSRLYNSAGSNACRPILIHPILMSIILEHSNQLSILRRSIEE